MTDRKTLSPMQARNRLRRQGVDVSDRTIRRMVKRGDLGGNKTATRYMVDQDDVDRLARGGQPPTCN